MSNDITKTGTLLAWGPNQRDGKTHTEWHAPCGCAWHVEPAPHWHPCALHSSGSKVLNARDLKDIGDVIYWLAAVRAELENMPAKEDPEEFKSCVDNALRCLGEAEQPAERIALGTNRKNATKVTAPTKNHERAGRGVDQ